MMRSPFSIYLHIPYCLSKCPYCDFNSYAVGKNPSAVELPESEYVRAMQLELEHYATQPEWKGRDCNTVFFGGGTPSLFRPSAIAEILNVIGRHFRFVSGAEVTLEANPGTVHEVLDVERLKEFRRSGVNRVSLGVQSLNPEKLKFLGRTHSIEDSLSAVENIRSAGFDNLNCDVIFGVKGESLESWVEELPRLCALGSEHISAYALTIEPGTEFGRLAKRGTILSANDDQQGEMLDITQEILASRGYQQYEVSNYALPKRECRHNLAYWQREDYLGIGAGAHGFCGTTTNNGSFGFRWRNIPSPQQYIMRVDQLGQSALSIETIESEQAISEYLFVFMRTSRGGSVKEFSDQFGIERGRRLTVALNRLAEQELVYFELDRYCPTVRGFRMVDGIIVELMRAVSA